MKKLMIVGVMSLAVGACATTATTAPNAAMQAAVADEEVWQETQLPEEETDVACTRCAPLEQQRQMQEIIQQIVDKSIEEGKSIEDTMQVTLPVK